MKMGGTTWLMSTYALAVRAGDVYKIILMDY